MTAVVGVLCKNGVVIGTDSSATFGPQACRTIEQPTEKIEIIDSHVIVAGSGAIGLGQRFCAIVKQAWAAKLFQQGSALETCRKLCASTVKDFSETAARKGDYSAVLAFHCDAGYQLCEFDQDTLQPELKTASMVCLYWQRRADHGPIPCTHERGVLG